MSRVHYLEGDYEQLVINETIDGLFSSYRIDRNSLPKGFFLYEIRCCLLYTSLADVSGMFLRQPFFHMTVTETFPHVLAW